MRSSWITQGVPESSDKCPYKWRRHRHRGDVHGKMEAEIAAMLGRLEAGRDRCPVLEPLEETWPS